MRYRFYREHKYINFVLFELEKEIRKIEFSDELMLSKLLEKFIQLSMLIKGHMEFESNVIHPLLKNKNILLYTSILADHQNYLKGLKELEAELQAISNTNLEDKIQKGYIFYINFRLFIIRTLELFNQEETFVMIELQKHYSDNELRQIHEDTYNQMKSEDIVQMFEVLFPHMNSEDQHAYFADLKYFDPQKFDEVWHSIGPKLADLINNSNRLELGLEKAMSLEDLQKQYKEHNLVG